MLPTQSFSFAILYFATCSQFKLEPNAKHGWLNLSPNRIAFSFQCSNVFQVCQRCFVFPFASRRVLPCGALPSGALCGRQRSTCRACPANKLAPGPCSAGDETCPQAWSCFSGRTSLIRSRCCGGWCSIMTRVSSECGRQAKVVRSPHEKEKRQLKRGKWPLISWQKMMSDQWSWIGCAFADAASF